MLSSKKLQFTMTHQMTKAERLELLIALDERITKGIPENAIANLPSELVKDVKVFQRKYRRQLSTKAEQAEVREAQDYTQPTQTSQQELYIINPERDERDGLQYDN